MERRLFEVKLTTYTRVVCESAEQAEAFAREALDTAVFDVLDTPGSFHSFSIDDADVIDDTDNCDPKDLED